eukprot:14978903-Alexandrium_andersonii.AAC.1
MSASLVGSEMCIRDRRPSCSGAGSRSTRSRAGGRPAVGHGPLPGSRRSCLLYTSDAADDM